MFSSKIPCLDHEINVLKRGEITVLTITSCQSHGSHEKITMGHHRDITMCSQVNHTKNLHQITSCTTTKPLKNQGFTTENISKHPQFDHT